MHSKFVKVIKVRKTVTLVITRMVRIDSSVVDPVKNELGSAPTAYCAISKKFLPLA